MKYGRVEKRMDEQAVISLQAHILSTRDINAACTIASAFGCVAKDNAGRELQYAYRSKDLDEQVKVTIRFEQVEVTTDVMGDILTPEEVKERERTTS